VKETGTLRDKRRFSGVAVVILVVCGLFLLAGCGSKSNIPVTGEYQAVFMDTGQIFFGKLENAGSDYPVLKNVFYIRQQTNPETKEVKSVLIRRGNEWHGPDRMIINARHIGVIEPVGADSQVAKLIKEAEAKPAAK